jgi:hypothetical protein
MYLATSIIMNYSINQAPVNMTNKLIKFYEPVGI